MQRIRIKISQKSNIKQLASEIVEKCKLLGANRTLKVQELLQCLLKRKMEPGYESRQSLNKDEKSDYLIEAREAVDFIVPPSMDFIEEYIESLYEGIKEKLIATRKILYLAKIPENMETLLKNGNL
jgi:hypothetical protein